MIISHPIKNPAFAIDLRKFDPLVVVLAQRLPVLKVSKFVQLFVMASIRREVKLRFSQLIRAKLDDYVSIVVQLSN